MNLIVVPEELPSKVYRANQYGISTEGLNYHLEIWQGIINRFNSVLTQFNDLQVKNSTSSQKVNENLRGLKLQYQSNYATHIHHKIYFETLGGNGNQPVGKVAELIQRDFGSYENWLKQWDVLARSARAWVFLAYDYMEDHLFTYIADAQFLGCMWDQFCILAMDVTEHAYYLDFANGRASYIDAYIKSIDWEAVENRFQKSKGFIASKFAHKYQ